ncbi:hypothetical protein IQ07DRAFT_682486 [Pyrenochaeta sp. DS3sAY3a]|nr:hypothetical protein IQ07DRAFT_682486 [Pyrenochaeta sp. DS3sAY3a]
MAFLEPRKKKKTPKIKIKGGGSAITNWKLALIIIGSIVAAILIAALIWWLYKRRQAKKAVGTKGGEDMERLEPEKRERGSLDDVEGAYRDGRTQGSASPELRSKMKRPDVAILLHTGRQMCLTPRVSDDHANRTQ